jgi:molecular chaperone GrpE
MNEDIRNERPEGSGPNDDTPQRPEAEPHAGRPADAAPSTATALQEDPESIRIERDDYRDRLLRTMAEFENYRKRVERDRRDLSEHAASELLKELLPLVDDLERALAATPGADSAGAVAGFRAGVELINRQLLDLLRKRGVTAIEALGTDFDPHVHQAVSQEVSEAHRDGEVTEELRRGYKLGDRLLRPAMVKVATRE